MMHKLLKVRTYLLGGLLATVIVAKFIFDDCEILNGREGEL